MSSRFHCGKKIISIGGTASGKTTVAKRIAQDGERAVILDQDSYYKNLTDISLEERRSFNLTTRRFISPYF